MAITSETIRFASLSQHPDSCQCGRIACIEWQTRHAQRLWPMLCARCRAEKTKCKNIGFSVVISTDNYKDLPCTLQNFVSLGRWNQGNSVCITLGISIMNQLRVDALAAHEEFVAGMLTSKRRGLKNGLKDYGRAYFNRKYPLLSVGWARISSHHGCPYRFLYRPPNVSHNGSGEERFIGNIKEERSLRTSWSRKSEKALRCCL